jgi:hypothetical protein
MRGADLVTDFVIEPPPEDRIVGFYGRSIWNGGCADVIEFGILTAPRDFVLPESAYQVPELQNIDGGDETRAKVQQLRTLRGIEQ